MGSLLNDIQESPVKQFLEIMSKDQIMIEGSC